MILRINNDYFLNSNSQLILVMEMRCVFFEVSRGLLNIVYINFRLQRVCSLLIYIQTRVKFLNKELNTSVYLILSNQVSDGLDVWSKSGQKYSTGESRPTR
jgi:hypothetical protein